jgi:predicted RNA-binding protein with PIN domain
MTYANPQRERIGDIHRELCQSLLQSAYTEGYITLDEYGERTTAVADARYRDELIVVTQDMPTKYRWQGQMKPAIDDNEIINALQGSDEVWRRRIERGTPNPRWRYLPVLIAALIFPLLALFVVCLAYLMYYRGV